MQGGHCIARGLNQRNRLQLTVPRMAEFDNPLFDLDVQAGRPGMDDDFALPSAIMDPPAEVQDQLNISVDRIPTL
ncbi:MAG: hypothetical protein AB2693_30470 [Candidatus Thiodiazotropha sp.]